MKSPNYEIVEETEEYILIRDIGPWDTYPTVTNGAEEVVRQLAHRLGDRRLEYIDSEGIQDQLIVVDGKFAGFAPSANRNQFIGKAYDDC